MSTTDLICTCPSGDGSLRWPCPAHPPEAATPAPAWDAATHKELVSLLCSVADNLDDGGVSPEWEEKTCRRATELLERLGELPPEAATPAPAPAQAQQAEALPPLPPVDYDAGWHRQYTADQMRAYARAALAATPAPAPQWVPVSERLPDANRKVLATYTNELGNRRTIVARWTPAKTVEADTDDDEGVAEYDEATDTYYLREGWWEAINNWGDYSQVFVNEGKVDHWMPLPAAPEGQGKEAAR